jgi:hypothetical protein
MMIPDYRLIAEVQLYAAGFQTAGALAAHLVSVLKVPWGSVWYCPTVTGMPITMAGLQRICNCLYVDQRVNRQKAL